MSNTRRVWVEIDLHQLCENYRRISRAVAPCNVLAVLKANAYGLGVEPVARALAQAGAWGFGVAEPHEAEQLLGVGRKGRARSPKRACAPPRRLEVPTGVPLKKI